jgi:hypothetical protein
MSKHLVKPAGFIQANSNFTWGYLDFNAKLGSFGGGVAGP